MKLASPLISVLFVFVSMAAFADNEAVLRHYREGVFSTLKTADGLRLATYVHEVQDERAAVVFVSGRTESHMKYAELFMDLNERGYSVYSYDHRGQGLSEGRLASAPEKGDIKNFDLYVDDLRQFVEQVVLKKKHRRLYLLTHSLGGVVAGLYIERNPRHPFRAVAMSSPMFGMQTGHNDLTVNLVTCLNPMPKSYARGKGPADPNEPFEGNTLTTSRTRYQFYMSQMTSDPRDVTGSPRVQSRPVLLGGPTNRWVCRSLHATWAAKRNVQNFRAPLWIEGADDDQIVRVQDEIDFCGKAPDCRFHMNDSKHEIFMERDEVRDGAIDRILDFFERN